MLFSSKTQHSQAGFSLIELLIVVGIVGVLAAIVAPLLLDARVTSQRTAAISNMRTMHTAEHNYFHQNSRYANLSELNTFQGGGLGTMMNSTELTTNGYTYQMVPPAPSTTSLATNFTIESNGYERDGTPAKYMVSTNGTMQQVLPVSRYLVKFE
ncbi:MAG: prepilin-type N-terminal cleavage/methylation domain-containing protein [Blastocatellia bacterium]